VVAALAAAVRPGGHVSVLTAGRLGAVLGQTLAGRFAQALATLTAPDGRYSELDPLQRRYDASGIGKLLTDSGLFVVSVTGVGVLSGLVSGAAWQAVPGGDAELARLEAAASAHPALLEVATDLHVIARRPAAGRFGVDEAAGDLPASDPPGAADPIGRGDPTMVGPVGSVSPVADHPGADSGNDRSSRAPGSDVAPA